MAGAAQAELALSAPSIDKPITLDGDAADWAGISGITVPLKGKGNVDTVEVKAVVHDDMIYMLAIWDDSTENKFHKPYKWNEGTASYKTTKEQEDRFVVTLKMSGEFTPNKFDGSIFTADVWHWKSQRSNTVGLVHDKMWKVDTKPFEKAKELKGANGNPVYLKRSSDKGDKLYKKVKYSEKFEEKMPRYQVNDSAKGSIADVKAKGVWKDGKWTLEIARKLNTGNTDDAVIPAEGTLEIAFGLFNGTSSRRHSTSDKIILKTGGATN
ncbi:MAG: hypothetical protein JKY12_01595 [Sneathiella sp.]|nr:hypothetical protein [Sneathiella sp.]